MDATPKRWLLRELRDLLRDPWMKLMAFATALFWLGRNGWRKSLLFAFVLLAILASSTQGIRDGYYMFTGTLLSCAVFAFVARLVWEASRHYREKTLLRRAFAGHVSPQVMRAILGGEIQPDEVGQLSRVTILFSDIRGFTARSERESPAALILLLNRYFNEAAAAIHSKGGSIDKYIGDGIMATFGIPQALESPERNALEAAQEILVRLARLNEQLAAEGQPPLEIGIGTHSGEVLAGYVGSRKRRDFTIIGDPVNTASRLEGITKLVGYPVVCSNEVAAAVGYAGGLVDLGPQEIKGRSPVHVWGWNPPLMKRVSR